MTVEKAITLASDIKPHAFSEATLIQWLNEAEGHIMTEVLRVHPEAARRYETETDSTKILTVPPPFDKLYSAYLTAMIDFANGEYDKFQNSREIYNAAVDEYAKWYIRNIRENPYAFDERNGRFIDYLDTVNDGVVIWQGDENPNARNIRHIGIWDTDGWDILDGMDDYAAILYLPENLFDRPESFKQTGDFRDAKGRDQASGVIRWMMYSYWYQAEFDAETHEETDVYRQIFSDERGNMFIRRVQHLPDESIEYTFEN